MPARDDSLIDRAPQPQPIANRTHQPTHSPPHQPIPPHTNPHTTTITTTTNTNTNIKAHTHARTHARTSSFNIGTAHTSHALCCAQAKWLNCFCAHAHAEVI
mmetsp:Transcript_52787/g.121190  ORF Transcript_52787/g.121190 Transcript_52787/m.121190 type:complete len:102 (-) Transcript_52787:177-482(-)